MSKERLEEIKVQVKYLQGDLMRDDLGWLIEQAERAQELEEAIADYAYEIGKRKRALNKKNEQNKRYREVFGHMRRIILHPFSKTINKHETLYKIETILRELEGED